MLSAKALLGQDSRVCNVTSWKSALFPTELTPSDLCIYNVRDGVQLFSTSEVAEGATGACRSCPSLRAAGMLQ